MASHNSQHDNDASDIGIPVWGTHQRDIKARKILCVIEHFGPLIPTGAKWVDLGCGSGGIAVALAPHVGEIIGVDPEPWPQWQELSARASNLRFITQSTEQISLPDACADVVICNQVYEHVPDPQLLIRQIYRILKPGGYCYFAGPNLSMPALARAMQAVGAHQGMLLDINAYWVHFSAVRMEGGKLAGDPLLPEMKQSKDRYLSPYSRDFFYVTTGDAVTCG